MGKLTFIRWSHVSALAVLAYWAAMTLGTHLPGPAVPEIPYSDKSLHFMAYAGLGFLLAWAWATRRPFLWGGPVFALLVAAGWGGLDEITQALIPGRDADVVDWLYDTAGTLTGIGGFLLLERFVRRMFGLGRSAPDQ
jgi:VanZ family protein